MMENSTPAAPAPKAKRAKATKKPLDHPKYTEMITGAIRALNRQGRVSRQAIQKYIAAKYHVSNNANFQVKLALKKLVLTGVIRQTKGFGASGSFRLAKGKGPKAAAEKAARAPRKGATPVTRKVGKASPKPKKAKVEKKKAKSPKKKANPAKKTKKAKPAKGEGKKTASSREMKARK